jgi:phosphoserine phosphatase
MMAWCFAGFGEDEVAVYAEAVLDEIGFDRAVRRFTAPLLRFAEQHAHPFWLVSASPLAVVRAAARRLGLDPARCVAMEPAIEGGELLPRLAREPTYAEGKVARLRQNTEAALLAGFGDSLYDAALIAEGRIGVAVVPKPALVAVLGAGALVLEE